MNKLQPVGILDQQFVIANIMRDCPHRTVIYELLRNAIEATQSVGGGRIEWFQFDWNGFPKLGIYNEGVGLNARELNQKMEIGSTGKELGFDKNFGQGAKMSAGAASPYGLLCRTCKNGKVSEILLRVVQDTGTLPVLCKVAQAVPDSEYLETVIDVTDDAISRGRKVDVDWFEAVLLGRSETDNTLDGEFLGGTDSTLWLQRLINQRFYRFPAGIDVAGTTITSNRRSTHRRARGMEDVFSSESTTERRQIVKVNCPLVGLVEIEYGRLTSRDNRGGAIGAEGFPGASHVALIYRDEIYGYDSRWSQQAGYYGFGGASDGYFLHILIPDNAPVSNNNHRIDIIATADPDRSPLDGWRFREVIKQNRPQWVLDDIATRLKAQSSGRLDERYRKLLERFKAKTSTPVVEGEGEELGAIEIDRGISGPRPPGPELHPGPEPQPDGRDSRRQRGKSTNRVTPAGLQALFQNEDQEQWYESMNGLAGGYDGGNNVIWLSSRFRGYRLLVEWANQEWPGDEENGTALSQVDEQYRFHAMAFGAAAMGFRGQEGWNPDKWEECLKPEALSAHMMDPMDSIQTAVKAAVTRLVGKREAVEV